MSSFTETIDRLNSLSNTFSHIGPKFPIHRINPVAGASLSYSKIIESQHKLFENISTSTNLMNSIGCQFDFPHLKSLEAQRKLIESISASTDRIKDIVKPMELQIFKLPKLDWLDFDWLRKLETHPEVQFCYVTDSTDLSSALEFDTPIRGYNNRIELVDTRIRPFLENLGQYTLWQGSIQALRSRNPDKVRHCLISLRTIFEWVIDKKLAPKDVLLQDPNFTEKYKGYIEIECPRCKQNSNKITRNHRVGFIISKINFAFLEEFTASDLNVVMGCYGSLNKVHAPDITLSVNQAKILLLKTGIVLLLLLYIDGIVSK